MEEAKFNNLCSHYKDTFEIHKISIKQRDRLFYSVLIILGIFTLQFSSIDAAVNIVNGSVDKIIGVKLEKNINFISTLLWFLLLGFTIRYFQVVIGIEGQYSYLHILEEELNKFYSGTKVFTREGKSYLSKYPLFSNWVWFLYTLIFPCLIIFCVIFRIKKEIISISTIDINLIIDFLCYLIIGTSSVLYIYKLHEFTIENIINNFINKITNWYSSF